jgi:hypothetical protein
MTTPDPRLAGVFNLEFPQSVGVFPTYELAQKVVDFLSEKEFPVENLCIVGTDLKSVERVLGRRTWATVVGQGAQSGLSTGLMIALLMMLFMPAENILLLLVSAVLVGLVIGVGMQAIAYWASRGKRDFTSVSQTVATRYEVLCEHKVVARARELAATLPEVRQAAFAPQGYAYPPQPAPQAMPQPFPGQPYAPSQPYAPAQPLQPGYPSAPQPGAQPPLQQAVPYPPTPQPYPPYAASATGQPGPGAPVQSTTATPTQDGEGGLADSTPAGDSSESSSHQLPAPPAP